jgi:hypothetical protein
MFAKRVKQIYVVDDRLAEIRFFDALLAKYGTGVPGRPKSFYPRLDAVTVLRTQRGARERKMLSSAAPRRAVAGARPDHVAERSPVTVALSASRDGSAA